MKIVKTLLLCLSVAGVFLFLFSTESSSRVQGTPHDLTFTTGGSMWQYGSDESCVFCHTPHQGTGTAAPLWNKSVPAGPFNMYTSATYDMGPASMDVPSLLCMSCHNGVGAMNVVYNTPGPGSTGVINDLGNFTRLGDVWYPGSPFGVVKNIAENDPNGPTLNRLSNDHPVSFVYNQGADQQGNGFPARVVLGNQGHIAGPSGTFYPLYGATTDRFECPTCHSVHDTAVYPNKGLAGGQVYFLRSSNAGSALCLDCHTLR